MEVVQQALYVVLGSASFALVLCSVRGARMAPDVGLRLLYYALFGTSLTAGLGAVAMMVLWGLVDMGWIQP